MQLPVIPSFTANETSVAHLTQLSAAVQFAAVASSYPLWRFYKVATQSVTLGVWNTLAFTTAAVDTDGINVSTSATIQTQGYYSTEACLPFQGNASGVNNLQGSFLFTAGPNNPNFSPGTAIRYGGTASSAATGTGTDWVQCMSDKCPAVCYPGDSVVVQVFPLFTSNIAILVNTSNTAGWFPCVFSGRWVRMGSLCP
jgi:hypothetical protein